ncbi:hypothetical protein [Nocardiopsis nanhaiensis]
MSSPPPQPGPHAAADGADPRQQHQHPYPQQQYRQQPPGQAQPSATAHQGTDGSEPDVRPPRYWYWIGGSVFPVSLLVSTLMLTNATSDDPALIVGGILLPMGAFVVSLGICITVFAVRASRLGRQRARRAHAAAAAHGAQAGQPWQQGPAFHGPPPPPPEISPKELRPRRRWMVVGALCLPVSIALGVSVFWAAGSTHADRNSLEFASDPVEQSGSATFTVGSDELDSLGLYVSPAGAFEEACELSRDEGVGSARFVERVTGYTHGDWRLAYSVAVDIPGTYTLECEGDAGAEYAIADTDIAVDHDEAMGLGFLGLLLVSFLGFLVTLVVTITVGVRRSSYRQRLIQEHRARQYQAGRPNL